MILPFLVASVAFVSTIHDFVLTSSSFAVVCGGLLIVDLKIGKISYADAGHMHLYLNNAREHSMNAHKLAEELGTKTPSSSKTKGGMPEPRDDLNPSHK
jgi:hypothetical protein